MGFELYLFCYENGEPSGIPREAVHALFPVLEEKPELNRWQIHYDAMNSCTINVKPMRADSARIESLCIERPCGDIRLFDSLFTILGMGSVFLVFPGLESYLAASESVHLDLPKEMIGSTGPPRIVRSGGEILEVIRDPDPSGKKWK